MKLYNAAADTFRRTDFMLRRCIGKKLRTLDEELYRSQHRLLMNLGANPNCSQNELAAKLEISPAAVAVSLNKLEKGGYIARKTNADDHRSNRVSITDRGNQVISRSIQIFDEVESGMFEGFKTEEVEQFCGFLQRAYRNLSRMQESMSAGEAEENTAMEREAEE
ncbi:MAG: MarR family transcriptional regulator [Blautia sp.]|nr:MarR family transcriptional regulator [Blautia sp.]MCM1200701.1 MarR family transcriptional regulator [Bacteroides fragilis]